MIKSHQTDPVHVHALYINISHTIIITVGDVKVKSTLMEAGTVPDFVFKKNVQKYPLVSLCQLESSIAVVLFH